MSERRAWRRKNPWDRGFMSGLASPRMGSEMAAWRAAEIIAGEAISRGFWEEREKGE